MAKVHGATTFSSSVSGGQCKYEEVFLRAYESASEAKTSLGRHIAFYNQQRPHSALDGLTPDAVYFTPEPLAQAA